MSIYFFFLPSFNLGILYSFGISKIFIGLCFIFFLINPLTNYKGWIKNRFLYLLVFYFFTQSISIINSIDVFGFVNRYKDFIFEIVFFLVSVDFFLAPFLNTMLLKKIFKIIIFITFFNLFYEFLMLVNGDLATDLSEFLRLHPTYINYIQMNIERGRVYLQAYDEVLIPILLLLLLKEKKLIKRLFFFILILLISIISFSTMFRTRFLMLIFAFFTSFLFLNANNNKKIFYYIVLFSLVFGFFYSVCYFYKQSVIDRFVNIVEADYKSLDVMTVKTRIEQIFEVVNIALRYPLFGVGLGNYFYYIESKNNLSLFSQRYKEIFIIDRMPHNIFLVKLAETGLLGLSSFIFICFYFIQQDWIGLTQRDDKNLRKAFILSFWTLFFYGLFNPSYNLSYNIIFWLIRSYLFCATTPSHKAIKIA